MDLDLLRHHKLVRKTGELTERGELSTPAFLRLNVASGS